MDLQRESYRLLDNLHAIPVRPFKIFYLSVHAMHKLEDCTEIPFTPVFSYMLSILVDRHRSSSTTHIYMSTIIES